MPEALWQLTVARFRVFLREPSAVFWSFGFPLLLTVALGVAFRTRGAPQEGVAVVGNVFTHPAYRGRGYATAATGSVTGALLAFCDDVVLTVDPKNQPAVAAYRKLGYQETCELVEASAVRRDPAGIGAAFRRWRAAMRGRKYDGLFVTLRH